MKKLFGGINLTWIKLIIFAICAGVYTAVMAMIPGLIETSFHDIAVSFEVWILFGVIIIANSKSPIDSALKCLVFFLISQPLVYLVQDLVNHSNLFITYYRNWVMWTVACIPMGFLGYYIKKFNTLGLAILMPIIIFLGYHLTGFVSEAMFMFPNHLLSALFCVATMIIYPLYLFDNKLIKRIGVVSSIVIASLAIGNALMNPPVYETILFSNSEEHPLKEGYKAYFKDKKYGTIEVKYDTKHGIDDYVLEAKFTHGGKTEFTIEDNEGNKKEYTITIKRNTYNFKEK